MPLVVRFSSGHRSGTIGAMMRYERSYSCDDEEARARLKALTDYWDVKHGVPCDWDGGRARLAGKKLGVKYDATVTVRDGTIVAEVKAGFLAEKLGARSYVERKVDDYLDPANDLETLRARIPK